MGDVSQSRYSIVERLTTQKLEIMEDKQKIEGDIEAKKTKIIQIQNDMKIKERESEELLKSDLVIMQQDIASLDREIASLEKGKNTKASLCDSKIKEIDKALAAITQISAESAKEEKS
jgi:hypothetical protein